MRAGDFYRMRTLTAPADRPRSGRWRRASVPPVLQIGPMARASRDAADEAGGPARPPAVAPRTGSAEIVADPGGKTAPTPEDKAELNGEAPPASNPDDEDSEQPRAPSDP